MTRDDRSGERAVEWYLASVRRGLGRMPAAEAEEILRELRAHIEERAGAEGDHEAALRSLGDPNDLARAYRGERAVARMECSRSPIVVLHGMLMLGGRTFSGRLALALAALGYTWAFALVGLGIEKILSSGDVGLWVGPGSWRLMVDGAGPPGTREVLGWWMVPAGLVAGALLFFLTRKFGLWWIHRSRDARAEAGGR